jgi:DNA-binding transcriptional ArsR family regulator
MQATGLMGLVSRAPHQRLLEDLNDGTRARILDLLAREGSESKAGIARCLGLARSTVGHHLRILERSGLVRQLTAEGSRGGTVLFMFTARSKRQGPFSDEKLALLAKGSGTRRSLVKVLMDGGPKHAGALAIALRIEGRPVSRQSILYHLRALEQAGMVRRARQDLRVFFSWAYGPTRSEIAVKAAKL